MSVKSNVCRRLMKSQKIPSGETAVLYYLYDGGCVGHQIYIARELYREFQSREAAKACFVALVREGIPPDEAPVDLVVADAGEIEERPSVRRSRLSLPVLVELEARRLERQGSARHAANVRTLVRDVRYHDLPISQRRFRLWLKSTIEDIETRNQSITTLKKKLTYLNQSFKNLIGNHETSLAAWVSNAEIAILKIRSVKGVRRPEKKRERHHPCLTRAEIQRILNLCESFPESLLVCVGCR